MTIRKTLTALAGAGAVTVSMGTAATAGGVVNSPVADWTGGAVMCEIIHQIAEREMGYKVKRITMPSGPAVEEGMANGDLDYACEMGPSYNASKSKGFTE